MRLPRIWRNILSFGGKKACKENTQWCVRYGLSDDDDYDGKT